MKIDPSRYAPEALKILGLPVDADELTRIVSVDTLDDVFANEPSKQFAELLRLPHFDWLSFSYVERDTQNRDGSWPDAIPVS